MSELQSNQRTRLNSPGQPDLRTEDEKYQAALNYMDKLLPEIHSFDRFILAFTIRGSKILDPTERNDANKLEREIQNILTKDFRYASQTKTYELELTDIGRNAKRSGGHFKYLESMKPAPTFQSYCIAVLREYNKLPQGRIESIEGIMQNAGVPEPLWVAVKTDLSNNNYITCYMGSPQPCSFTNEGRAYLAKFELGDNSTPLLHQSFVDSVVVTHSNLTAGSELTIKKNEKSNHVPENEKETTEIHKKALTVHKRTLTWTIIIGLLTLLLLLLTLKDLKCT